MHIIKIISGGQSGVDRSALDAAIASSIAYWGWCPKGGWAEDAPTPPGVLAQYPNLLETPGSHTEQRTEWNVRDSDAVLVLVDQRGAAISAGTLLAIEFAEQYGKPFLCLCLQDPARLGRAQEWLAKLESDRILNIAGPRESEAPGIYGEAQRFLMDLLFVNA